MTFTDADLSDFRDVSIAALECERTRKSIDPVVIRPEAALALLARLEAAEYALMRFQIIPMAERTRGMDEALERWRKSKGEEGK